jgi:hypothetical protein
LPLVERIKAGLEQRRKMLLVTALEGAHLARADGSDFCIEFPRAARHLRDTLARSENARILREVCCEVTGRNLGVRLVIQDPTEEGPASQEDAERREAEHLRQKAEEHPVVQQMLRTFRGELVDVRPASKNDS